MQITRFLDYMIVCEFWYGPKRMVYDMLRAIKKTQTPREKAVAGGLGTGLNHDMQHTPPVVYVSPEPDRYHSPRLSVKEVLNDGTET